MTATASRRRVRKYDGPSPEQKLVENLINLIEQGVNPWRKEWKGIAAIRHTNISTGKPYQGANPMMLEFQMISQEYTIPLWIGFAQAKAKGWYPRKGTCGAYILRPQLNQYEVKDEDGKVVVNPDTNEPEMACRVSYKTACVFNVQALQGEGLQEAIDSFLQTVDQPTDNQRIENAQQVLEGWEVETIFGGDRAYYLPSMDRIHMPKLEDFHNSEAFYATWAHECIHSTGHDSRLKRKLGTRTCDGMMDYAREELVAEMGAYIVANRLAISSNVENHAAYLEHWAKVLKQGPKVLFKVISDATKAANMIVPDTVGDDA